MQVVPGLTAERGGVSTFVRDLAESLARRGHEVTVVTTDQGRRSGEQAIQLGAAVRCEVASCYGPERLAYSPSFARRLRAALDGADAVHIHSIFTHPAHVALSRGVRDVATAVFSPHGMLHPYSLGRHATAKRLYLGLAAAIGPLGHPDLRWHFTSPREAAESWRPAGSRAWIVPPGFRPWPEPEGPGKAAPPARSGERPYALFLGRIHPKKRVDLAVNAALALEGPGRLVVAGPDESGLWAALEERSRARGTPWDARIERVGVVSGVEKRRLVEGAALLVLPSEHENYGIVVLEALACGVPVLASPEVDGATDPARAGLARTVPLQAEAWKAALAAGLADQGWRSDVRRRGPAWASGRAWERLAERFERLYDRSADPNPEERA